MWNWSLFWWLLSAASAAVITGQNTVAENSKAQMMNYEIWGQKKKKIQLAEADRNPDISSG